MSNARPNRRRKTPIVALLLCRCPRCGSSDCKTTGTLESNDQFISQRKHCRACSLPFVANFS